MPLAAAAALFVYTFVATVALAVVPHEPAVILAGGVHGVWSTAVVATLATVSSALMDFVAFAPFIKRMADRPLLTHGAVGWMRRRFASAPFAVLALSGITPLPAWPFKAIAFAEHYPLGRYLAATAVGRFPRYVLLAWLGVVTQIPMWVLIALFVALMLPSLRTAWIQRKGT
ncbi:MAG: VTT domain-containing protein [Gemmatimonadales bacterium]